MKWLNVLVSMLFFFVTLFSCRKEQLAYDIDNVQYKREYERPGVVIDDSTKMMLTNYLKQINDNDSNDFKVQFVHKQFVSDMFYGVSYCGYVVNNGIRVYPYLFERVSDSCYDCNRKSFLNFFSHSDSETEVYYRCNLKGVRLDTVANLREKEVIKTFLDVVLMSDLTIEEKEQNLNDTISIKFGYYALPDTSGEPVTLIKCWRLKTSANTRCVALVSDLDNTILNFTSISFWDEIDMEILEGY